MTIDPSLIGLAVTVATNEATTFLGVAGGSGVIRGVSIDQDRTGTYCLFLVEMGSGRFATLEAGNCSRATSPGPPPASP